MSRPPSDVSHQQCPRDRPARLRHFFAAGAILSSGCVSSNPWSFSPRPAKATPERFNLPDTKAATPGCRSPLTDPRDDTRLVLFRSTVVEGRIPMYLGDYVVTPTGRYGVGSRELLRVDCDNQRGMGVVDRS